LSVEENCSVRKMKLNRGENLASAASGAVDSIERRGGLQKVTRKLRAAGTGKIGIASIAVDPLPPRVASTPMPAGALSF
jgi:hypothetical protein